MKKDILDFFKGNYPKKAIQMLENYFENGFGRNLLHENECINMLKVIKDTATLLNILSSHNERDLHIAYMHGLMAGSNNSKEILDSENEYCDYANKRNFMFALNFHDNDFGNYFEDGANVFCNLYKGLLSQISIHTAVSEKDEKHDYSITYKQELEDLEKIENVIKIIRQGFFSSAIENKLTDSYYFKYSKKSIDEVVEEIKSYVDVFNLNDISKLDYFIGTVEEVEKQVIDNWNLEEKTPTNAKDMWLNGEVLFIKVKDGVAKCWIQ